MLQCESHDRVADEESKKRLSTPSRDPPLERSLQHIFRVRRRAEKPVRKPVRNEAGNGLRNEIGTVAMARTGEPHSATAQFFINVSNNEFLNFKFPTPEGYGYAVFGKVTAGMEVVHQIERAPIVGRGRYPNIPAEPVLIQSARILRP